MKISLKTKNVKSAIVLYLEILYKFHRLTDKESKVLVEVIYMYKTLLDKYDTNVAEKLYLGNDARKEICENLDMDRQVFRNYLVTFRKKGIIIADKLHKAFIPEFDNIELTVSIDYGG